MRWHIRIANIFNAGLSEGWSRGYVDYLLNAEIRKGGIPDGVAFMISQDYAKRRNQ